ncbi:MAG: 3-dehydroquinate synthase family protein [Phycisphaerales bacterium]
MSPGQAALVVIDSRLEGGVIEPILRSIDRARARWGVCVVPATETDKSLVTAERALTEAARIRLGRDGLVIGVGGGIVTDVAGFVAAVLKRGVRHVQCPTSLLAMVDAAVGGKTAVNLSVPAGGPGQSVSGPARLLKNAVGVFHQPARVVCDVGTLTTLPRRELRCGLAECLKHALIAGSATPGARDLKLLDWTERALDQVLALDQSALIQLVARNLAIKIDVVSRDPFEHGSGIDGGRMMLNLGHTFAHVFETLPGLSWPDPAAAAGPIQLGPLKHGEAVALGLLCATRVAERIKLLAPARREPPLSERLHVALHRIGLPTRVSGLPDASTIVDRMLDDKKIVAGRLRLILPARGFQARIVTEPAREAVVSAIDALRDAR